MTAANYRSEDLRRRSFEGQLLESADFGEADLRGADFPHARLAGANFQNAKLGVPTAIGAIRGRFGSSQWEDVFGASEIVVILLVFVGVMIWRGFDVAVKVLLVFTAVALVVRLIAGRVDVATVGSGLVIEPI